MQPQYSNYYPQPQQPTPAGYGYPQFGQQQQQPPPQQQFQMASMSPVNAGASAYNQPPPPQPYQPPPQQQQYQQPSQPQPQPQAYQMEPGMSPSELTAKRGRRGCCPGSACGKICCCICITIALIILAFGIAAAVIYRGKPDASIKSQTTKGGSIGLTEASISVDIVVEVNNPNNIEVSILSMLVRMYYPQGGTVVVGNATLPDVATIKKATISTFTVSAKIYVTKDSAPDTFTRMFTDCATSPRTMPMTASLDMARVRLLSTDFDVPGLPYTKDVVVNCP